MKTKATFNPNPAKPAKFGSSPAVVDTAGIALAAFYWAARASWADAAIMKRITANAVVVPQGVERLYGNSPAVFYIDPSSLYLQWACPLNWKPVGTVATVPANSVLQHKRYINGCRVVSYYGAGTRFREVSKGSPLDEAVWEVLPPA